jgi:predicted nucleotidyltransferase
MTSVFLKRDPGTMERTESSILKMLAYYSIFQYPLLKEELKMLLPSGVNASFLDSALKKLETDGIIFKIDGFYLLQSDMMMVKNRREGNLRAEKLLPKAIKIGKFLSRFPYVRGIGISGSLSKNYASETADIDFFIITKANRLWIARTIMHLFKKLTFLTGNQHFYCMNYYVDEKALRLEEQNIYTAIEMITLMPARGEGLHNFFTANNWVNDWFGSYAIKSNQSHLPGKSFLKRMTEWLFNNKAGERLDDYLMKKTTRRWKQKKERKVLNYEGKEMELITGKHFARSNPSSFQEKVLTIYNQKINELRKKWPDLF